MATRSYLHITNGIVLCVLVVFFFSQSTFACVPFSRGMKVVEESRHGPGFWQNGMQNLADDEFTAKVVAGGRAHALRLVGKTWRAHSFDA